jgi:TfoX/Sxy family transcriptional regulator of competence genes
VAYNQELSRRILQRVGALPGMTEKKMFGGVGYILNGNMACGVHQDQLIVRLTPLGAAAALNQPHVHPFALYGKTMPSWILVDPAACETDEDLYRWIQQGLDCAGALPPK